MSRERRGKVEPEAMRSCDAMFGIIGSAQFGDMLVEVDGRSKFSEMLLGRRARSFQELVAAYGALLAATAVTFP